MTEMWQDPDFFKLTDEAWASYVRRTMRGSTDGPESAPDGLRTSSRGVPVSQPRIETQAATAPLSATEETLDFTASCECSGCDEPCEYFIQFHPADRDCRHPIFDDRLQKQLVCGRHLQGFEHRAAVVVAKLNHRPWWSRKWKAGKCPTCGRPIQLESDVLQVVRSVA